MVSKGIDDFLKFLREVEQTNRCAVTDEQEASDETQDILHLLELEEQSYHDSAQLAKKLKSIRQARRRAKDTITQTVPIIEWIKSNRNVINGLEQLLGRVRKEEKNAEGRIYTPKTNVISKYKKSNKERSV